MKSPIGCGCLRTPGTIPRWRHIATMHSPLSLMLLAVFKHSLRHEPLHPARGWRVRLFNRSKPPAMEIGPGNRKLPGTLDLRRTSRLYGSPTPSIGGNWPIDARQVHNYATGVSHQEASAACLARPETHSLVVDCDPAVPRFNRSTATRPIGAQLKGPSPVPDARCAAEVGSLLPSVHFGRGPILLRWECLVSHRQLACEPCSNRQPPR